MKSQKKRPNQWGLYDLSGNVWEWVWNEYGLYKAESSKNPVGPLLGGSLRVNRGGSWSSDARGVRISDRDGSEPGYRFRLLGFRLARSHP